MKILVIHGPNLNLLGTREPKIYGHRTLAEINALIVKHGRERDIEVITFQSNHEGAIIDRIQGAAAEKVSAIVINPGAYSHTSMAIMDAIRSVTTPVVEVHLTNIFARESVRAHSVTGGVCRGVIMGFGFESYLLGIDAAARLARPARRARANIRTRRRTPKRRS